jgi:hypothetical protein
MSLYGTLRYRANLQGSNQQERVKLENSSRLTSDQPSEQDIGREPCSRSI